MKKRLSGVLLICLTLLLLLGCCHEALHHDVTDECFICAWIASFREMLALLLITVPAAIGLYLIPLLLGSVLHPSNTGVMHATPVRLHVKLTD